MFGQLSLLLLILITFYSNVINAKSCSLLGVYISFFIESAPAPTIIMLMSILFIMVFTYQQIKNKVVIKKQYQIVQQTEWIKLILTAVPTENLCLYFMIAAHQQTLIAQRQQAPWSYNKEPTIIFADLSHEFNNGWQAKASVRKLTQKILLSLPTVMTSQSSFSVRIYC
jgi:hypothetical protein